MTKMPFELTDKQIYLAVGGDKKLLKQFSKAQVCNGYKAIAHEAQKELVKWGNEICKEHEGGVYSKWFCFYCRKALLIHFGLEDKDEGTG